MSTPEQTLQGQVMSILCPYTPTTGCGPGCGQTPGITFDDLLARLIAEYPSSAWTSELLTAQIVILTANEEIFNIQQIGQANNYYAVVTHNPKAPVYARSCPQMKGDVYSDKPYTCCP